MFQLQAAFAVRPAAPRRQLREQVPVVGWQDDALPLDFRAAFVPDFRTTVGVCLSVARCRAVVHTLNVEARFTQSIAHDLAESAFVAGNAVGGEFVLPE